MAGPGLLVGLVIIAILLYLGPAILGTAVSVRRTRRHAAVYDLIAGTTALRDHD
jgi:hypothetical protein